MSSFQVVELTLFSRKLREFIARPIAMNHFHNVTMVTKTLRNLVSIIPCAHVLKPFLFRPR